MKEIRFNYTKQDGSAKHRRLLNPAYVKESYNKFTDVDNDKVNYVQGYEIDESGLSPDQIKMYEEAIKDFFNLALPTIEEFLSENNLDPKKVTYKTFKKGGISEIEIL